MTTNSTISNIFLRIKIGSDAFTYGDGKLISYTMSTKEGSEPNTCSFKVYDKDGSLADKYFAVVKALDGLEPVVVEKPENASDNRVADGELSPNIKALLDAIAWAEGANYNTLFGGGVFSSYERHPNRAITRGGFTSTAAGRYQFLYSTWEEVRSQIGATSFEPKWQDKGAVNRIANRGVLSQAEALSFDAVLDAISYEWASIPASNGDFRYPGQGTKTPTQFINYWKDQIDKYKNENQKSNTDSVDAVGKEKKKRGKESSLSGQQITVELGTNGKPLVKFSYLHVGLSYDLYKESTLVFDGASATLVMNLVTENTAYVNITTKKLAERICQKHGLTLDMSVEGAEYEYISQKNQTDMEFLSKECARLGLLMVKEGNKLTITPRKATPTDIVISRANLISFSIRHQAGSGDKGTREPKSSNETGRKKNVIDVISGSMVNTIPDMPIAAGAAISTTGSHVSENKPKTTGKTDTEDAQRLEKEQRVKGIQVNCSLGMTEALMVATVDNALKTEGIGASFIDRYWVIDSITHNIDSSGYITELTAYTPLKDKSPEPPASSGTSDAPSAASSSPNRKPNGFIAPQVNYVVTSGFRTARRPNHQGVDTSSGKGSPVYAMADGEVIDVNNSCVEGDRSCGGRYGRRIFINHAGGYQTRYAHLSKVFVTDGQSVKQGELIGEEGNTGDSSGSHLHSEIRLNGVAQNPVNFW